VKYEMNHQVYFLVRIFYFYLGVEVGEISTRFAHEAGDNGYLRLTNVPIPRNHMLMKLAYVCILFF